MDDARVADLVSGAFAWGSLPDAVVTRDQFRKFSEFNPDVGAWVAQFDQSRVLALEDEERSKGVALAPALDEVVAMEGMKECEGCSMCGSTRDVMHYPGWSNWGSVWLYEGMD